MMDEYMQNRQGKVIEIAEDVEACAVLEIGPFDNNSVFYPLCLHNGLPYIPVNTVDLKYAGQKFCYIETLWVDEAIRGHGHGRTLLDKCIAEATKQDAKVVFVIPGPDEPEKMLFELEDWFKSKGFVELTSAATSNVLMLTL